MIVQDNRLAHTESPRRMWQCIGAKLLEKRIMIALCLGGVWLLVGAAYIMRTDGRLQHDLRGHVEYTQRIYRDKALPSPYQGWQTYHPPVYYLVNQLAFPGGRRHIGIVRFMSVVYGGIFGALCLLACRWMVGRGGVGILATCYLMSTPAVIQLFSSYNNDGLTMVLSASFLMLLWSYWRTGRWQYWVLSVVIGTLAVYTKFSAIYLVLSVAIVVCVTVCLRILPLRKAFVIAGAICIPGIILLPWLYFHNYCSTGKLFPHNVEVPTGRIMMAATMENNGGVVRFLLAPPGISWTRWDSPYAIGRGEGNGWDWTKKDLMSSTLVTSVLGEFDYSSLTKRHPRLTEIFAWLALGFRLGLVGLLVTQWVPRMVLPGGIILTSFLMHIIHLAFVQPYVNAANYRYYAWVGLPLAVLLCIATCEGQLGGMIGRKVLKTMLTVGIFVQLAFLSAGVAC